MRPGYVFSRFAIRFAKAFAATVLLAPVYAGTAHAVGTEAGTIIESQATMTYKDAKNNSYTASSNPVTATVTEVYSVTLTCAGDQSVNSSTTAYYACTVRNTGNANNTFTLEATASPVWTTVIYRDDGAGSGVANDGLHTEGETTVTGSTGEIAHDTEYKFFVATTVPANKENGAWAVTTLTVTGTKDATAVDDASDTMKTTALAPKITVIKNIRNFSEGGPFDAEGITAKPLQILEYRLEVTNTSNDIEATEVELVETLNTHLEYVLGSMRYSAAATYEGASTLNDAASGDAPCNVVQECGTGNHSGGVLTFRLGLNATEGAGGTLGTHKTVYVFFHAKVK